MSRLSEDESQQILEAAYSRKMGGEGGSESPVVISCGGIFIPQPQGRPTQYHVLSTANEESPSKVVSGVMPQNMLHLVMAKESMN